MTRKTLLLALAFALPFGPLSAQSTAPGAYKDWNKVDSVEIVTTFKNADYTKIVVLPLDKSGITLPAETDNTFAPTKKILETSDDFFIEGLKKGISDFRKDLAVEKGGDGGSMEPKVLVVRGKLISLDPGSKAARAFGGFGAGAAKAKIAIDSVDAATGKVLAKMTHEKRAGQGAFGGSYEKVMTQSLNEVGQMFGKGLKGF